MIEQRRIGKGMDIREYKYSNELWTNDNDCFDHRTNKRKEEEWILLFFFSSSYSIDNQDCFPPPPMHSSLSSTLTIATNKWCYMILFYTTRSSYCAYEIVYLIDRQRRNEKGGRKEKKGRKKEGVNRSFDRSFICAPIFLLLRSFVREFEPLAKQRDRIRHRALIEQSYHRNLY